MSTIFCCWLMRVNEAVIPRSISKSLPECTTPKLVCPAIYQGGVKQFATPMICGSGRGQRFCFSLTSKIACRKFQFFSTRLLFAEEGMFYCISAMRRAASPIYLRPRICYTSYQISRTFIYKYIKEKS